VIQKKITGKEVYCQNNAPQKIVAS